MDFGNRIEEVLSEMLSEPLLQDFVHLRPTIVQKKERELCDVLIEDEPDAILIQLKVQDALKAKADRDEERWVRKQLVKAGRQIKGALKSLQTNTLKCFNPSRGELSFNVGQLKPRHGIVIVDYNSQPIIIDNNLENRIIGNIPIHYLTYNDFIVLCQSLKTLPDLMNYLDERAKIPKWSRPLLADEKNVYAYFLMNKSEFSYKVTRDDFANQWEMLTNRFKEKYSKKIHEDNQIELFTQILKAMYALDPIVTQFEPNFFEKVTTPKDPSRVEISRSLNRVTLLTRRVICKKLWEKLELADTSEIGFNYFSIMSQDMKTMYLFFCSRHERKKRLEELRTFSTMLYDLHKEIEKVIGVATENLHSANGRSFDFILIEGILREQDEDLLRQFKETFFKDLEYNKLYDFPDDKPQIIF